MDRKVVKNKKTAEHNGSVQTSRFSYPFLTNQKFLPNLVNNEGERSLNGVKISTPPDFDDLKINRPRKGWMRVCREMFNREIKPDAISDYTLIEIGLSVTAISDTKNKASEKYWYRRPTAEVSYPQKRGFITPPLILGRLDGNAEDQKSERNTQRIPQKQVQGARHTGHGNEYVYMSSTTWERNEKINNERSDREISKYEYMNSYDGKLNLSNSDNPFEKDTDGKNTLYKDQSPTHPGAVFAQNIFNFLSESEYLNKAYDTYGEKYQQNMIKTNKARIEKLEEEGKSIRRYKKRKIGRAYAHNANAVRPEIFLEIPESNKSNEKIKKKIILKERKKKAQSKSPVYLPVRNAEINDEIYEESDDNNDSDGFFHE